MTAFVLLHGSGDGGWAWHLVQRALHERGHESVAPDLPTDRDDATWDDCVEAVAAAAQGTQDVVVVGHSAGGFLVPLVADRLGARLQVHVAGMVPRAGERPDDWFDAVGWAQAVAALAGGDVGTSDPAVLFYEDVPPELAAAAMARERPTSALLGATPWPSRTLSDVAARYVVTTRDRFLPPPVQRRVAAERLGVVAPDGLDSGHCPALSRPDELAGLLTDLARSAPERP